MTMSAPSISLDQCVETLKSNLLSSRGQPKELARLYVAAVGLLCHLKKETLHLRSRMTKDDQSTPIPCPSAQEIPAMTRVQQDSHLFQSLLACLKGGPDSTKIESSDTITPKYSRKRSLSFQNDTDSITPVNKMLKLQQSPTKPPMKVAARSGDAQQVDVPMIPLPVLSATVLYSAFQHLNHWPAQLVEVYAEDAFGPRLWVDDGRCSLLVQNLSLCHQIGSEQEATVDEATEIQAAQVAQYYKNLPPIQPTNGNTAQSHANGIFTTRPNTGANKRQRSTSFESTDIASSTAPPSDSDPGDEEACLIEVSSGMLERAGNGRADDSSDSSSSGEFDAEVVEMSTTLETRASTLAATSTPNPLSTTVYPGIPTSLNLTRVRPRYFGQNLQHAHEAISESLSERLDLKFKQNSKLLMALPSFISIPAVRRLIARHLERWLQSPALSSQARTLFAATVQNMRNADPPIPEDIQAIDSIMEMKPKANQLNMHVENVTKIAKRIPSGTVARHIFLRILCEELAIMESGTHPASPTQSMKMMSEVYGAFPPKLACEGLAIAFLTLLAEPLHQKDGMNSVTTRERQLRMKRIRSLLRSVASALSSTFDGCGLIESMLSFDVNSNSWSLDDEKDKARLMYECATLLVPSPPLEDPNLPSHRGQRHGQRRTSEERSEVDVAALQENLIKVRKLLLDWCCTEYTQQWQERNIKQEEQDKQVKKSRKRKKKEEEVPAGAGTLDYGSALDWEEGTSNRRFADCINIMRCVLFMNGSDSTVLREFLYPGDSAEAVELEWRDIQYRIQQCYEYGSNFNDEMLRIVLKSAVHSGGEMDPSLALCLIENLFESCNKDKKASLQIYDKSNVWELYRLVEYSPTSSQAESMVTNGQVPNCTNIPCLAHPGMWWRVTVLALILCGTSPETIGIEMWNENPTIRAIIKMVTSGRYRFPTTDCDEEARSVMKSAEANMREEETRVAEVLFLPPAQVKKKAEKSENGNSPPKRGLRVSSRQREKQERLRRLEEEKEAAASLAEANRRKKLLRGAQKSIMLWDPKGPARKPPREEAVPLILSAEQLYSLSESFQQSVNPDFLLQTIGQTTRGAIERAFDWVIPIISSVPEIINRLPANASCFLLLRAYGEEGDGKGDLRKLSAPLVEHVKKSLTGEFGESNAVRAADLLLADLVDPNPDRRRCVIRVLRETLGDLATDDDDDSTGLLCLLEVKHAEAIVSQAIKYISQGLAFEKGKTLRALVVALDKYISFASERKTEGSWNFASILFSLISSRHVVCSEAMDRFPDFRSVAIAFIHREFLHRIRDTDNESDDDAEEERVLIRLCPSTTEKDVAGKNVSVPLALLQSVCVLLSIAKDKEKSDIDPAAKDAMQQLADALLYPCDGRDVGNERASGFASATLGSGDRAINVDQWVMLAKSRNNSIARRAALSAPTSFLPRLLLCSGLLSSSLLTMIDRLGKLGDKAQDRDVVFKNLLAPSATSRWASLNPGNRKDLVRKLVGRLSAYLHMNRTDMGQISDTFLEWLSEECTQQTMAKRARASKKVPKADQSIFEPFLTTVSSGTIASMLGNLEGIVDNDAPKLAEGSLVALETITGPASRAIALTDDLSDKTAASTFVETCFVENRSEALNAWLDTISQDRTRTATEEDRLLDSISVCISMLGVFFHKSNDKKDWFSNTVLNWVPPLSQLRGEPKLWTLIFSEHQNTKTVSELLRDRCASMWCKTHVKACQEWILSNHDALCTSSIIRFLIATSYQPAIHARSCNSSTNLDEDFWGSSEAGIKAGFAITVKGAKEQSTFDVNDPMILPDWLVMLFLLARSGKSTMMLVCEMLVSTLDQVQNSQVRSNLRSAILRLYVYFPRRMKLGNPQLRSVLIEGAKSRQWLKWSSALDPQLDDMLSSLTTNPSKRIIQALVDLSKSHPLLVLRKLPTMTEILEDDANVSKYSNARGRVYSENMLGPLAATVSGQEVKVLVRHWGYSFTESLWISLLDVFMSIPKEVLFSCGSHMGLGEFLEVYTRLLFIQSQLQSNPSRVKSKFSDVIDQFKATDAKGWEAWLSTRQTALPTLGNVRNVLMSCSLISPEASEADLRRAMQ